jgi:hypothetical protein
MKLTWSDYQQHQNRDDYDSLDRATVDALLAVAPPPMKNPAAQSLYDHSQQRLLRRLELIREEEKTTSEKSSHPDHKPKRIIPWVVGALTSIFVGLVIAYLKRCFPEVLR